MSSPQISQTPSEHSSLPGGIESSAAKQLRKGFPFLRFSAALEREYRHDHFEQSRAQVRFTLKLSLICALLFFAVGSWVHDPALTAKLNTWRIFVALPTFFSLLVVSYSRYYHQVFSRWMQVVAPIFGCCLVGEVLLAAQYGVSIFSVLVLLVFCMQVLVGMLFYAAIRSSLLVTLAYVVGVLITNAPHTQAIYDITVLFVTNAIGAAACYALEKAQRTTYLEAKLLTEAVNRDGLTGIYNRRAFDEHLDKMWSQASRDQTTIGLLLIDIDHFKAYNDHYGHQAGDECLQSVAHTLANCMRRPLDFVGRYGGEEFAIVLFNTDRTYVDELARRIHAGMAELALPHLASLAARQLTVSIGAAHVLPSPNRSRFGLIQLADEALYDVKGSGRNSTRIMDKEYEEMTTGVFQRRKAS